MELPIQVIVVLFIAVVVGGAIIAFSQNSLRNAQETLNDQWRKDPDNKDSIIDVVEADDQTIISLANECVRRSRGATADRKLCFAVFAESFTADFTGLQGTPLLEGFTLDTSTVSDPQAVRITFNPAGTVDVS